jgi:HEAT repeat protein
MEINSQWFAAEVVKDWSHAVASAAHNYVTVRQQVLYGLLSTNAEVRSAAVAVCNEANDLAAHDSVLELINDPELAVRGEVLEYLYEFAQANAATHLLQTLRNREHCFLATSALRRIYQVDGPILAEDESEEAWKCALLYWQSVLVNDTKA